MKKLSLYLLLALTFSCASSRMPNDTRSPASVDACDLSVEQVSSEPVYQTGQVSTYPNAGSPSFEEVKAHLYEKALSDCSSRFPGNQSCAVLEHSLFSGADGYGLHHGYVSYSVTAPKALSVDAIKVSRCEKAFACLGSKPSSSIVKVVKGVIKSNKCK